MRESRILYFALGALTVFSLGAVTNQVISPLTGSGLTLSDTGITFPDGTVQTTAAPARRQFYLTPTTHDGAAALSACAAGYHMASIFEILDPSGLAYNTTLGIVFDGTGPPTQEDGWIRTGAQSGNGQLNSGSKGDAGYVNCNAYTSDASDHDGTRVLLNPCWQEADDCNLPTGTEQTLASWWLAYDQACNQADNVWCVSD